MSWPIVIKKDSRHCEFIVTDPNGKELCGLSYKRAKMSLKDHSQSTCPLALKHMSEEEARKKAMEAIKEFLGRFNIAWTEYRKESMVDCIMEQLGTALTGKEKG